MPTIVQQPQPKKIVLQVVGSALRHILSLTFRHPKPRVRGIITHKDHILLVRNITDTHWDLPGGGYHKNETAAECLKREIHEELGIEINTSNKNHIVRVAETRNHTNWEFDCVSINIESLEPLTLSHELLEAGWFTRNALPSNTFSYVHDIW